MARYTDASCRLCRREGQKLFLKGTRCYTDKCAVARREQAPGQHGAKKKKLSEYADVLIQDVNLDSKIIYRVRIGPFATGEEAVELMEKIEQSGYTDISLVQEK